MSPPPKEAIIITYFKISTMSSLIATLNDELSEIMGGRSFNWVLLVLCQLVGNRGARTGAKDRTEEANASNTELNLNTFIFQNFP
mmetsp:Transcript_30381/g.46368  ORF Transcript_30381/g.46368 Transcript_30381/m.46368 type:complete len:85 (-) Transcript_30381:42-296(-)